MKEKESKRVGRRERESDSSSAVPSMKVTEIVRSSAIVPDVIHDYVTYKCNTLLLHV
jgi:hypothetical protein